MSREVTSISPAQCFGDSAGAPSFLSTGLGKLSWVGMGGFCYTPRLDQVPLQVQVLGAYPDTALTAVG